MTRSVIAVVVGYLVFGVSAVVLFEVSGVDPKATPSVPFAILSTCYGMAFAGAAGFVTATIAARSELRHGATVAGVIAVLATLSLVIERSAGSVWSQIASLVLMAPAAVAGGYVRYRIRLRRVGSSTATV